MRSLRTSRASVPDDTISYGRPSGKDERNRIDPAWVERMAANYPPQGECPASHDTMQAERVESVLRARGYESAGLHRKDREAHYPEYLNGKDCPTCRERRRAADDGRTVIRSPLRG